MFFKPFFVILMYFVYIRKLFLMSVDLFLHLGDLKMISSRFQLSPHNKIGIKINFNRNFRKEYQHFNVQALNYFTIKTQVCTNYSRLKKRENIPTKITFIFSISCTSIFLLLTGYYIMSYLR